jgi:hypothetical protein
MSRIREYVRENREAGMSARHSSIAAMADKTFDDLLEAADKGIDFDERTVRIAAVHTRVDVATLFPFLDEQLAILRSIRRWAMICGFSTVALVVILVSRG